jgi:lysophospholipase L1-like esterase
VNTRTAHFLRLIALAVACVLRAAPDPPAPEWATPDALSFVDDVSVAPLDTNALRKTLPRRGDRLASGTPYHILAIGDSVTATGPYPEILARLLRRSTDNANITVTRAAYPGKGVDAAVRRYARDIEEVPCDLALVMFGLNDQGSLSPVESYIEQTEWLVARLHVRGADVFLLEPTPHINIGTSPDTVKPAPPDAAIFRTITFAGALRTLGENIVCSHA